MQKLKNITSRAFSNIVMPVSLMAMLYVLTKTYGLVGALVGLTLLVCSVGFWQFLNNMKGSE